MRLQGIILAAAGLSVFTGLLVPASSQAAWRRVSASGCTASRTDTGALDLNGFYYATDAERGYSVYDNRSMQVTCPLEDASGFQKTDIDRVNVHTYDSTGVGNNYSRAYLCATSPFAIASSCGSSQTASGSGFKNLSLNTNDELGYATSGFSAAYFASVKIMMYTTSGANYQRYFGYWVTQ